MQIEQLKLGQTLDELEVLAHSDSQNTLVAKGDFIRILAVPVNGFDDLLVPCFASSRNNPLRVGNACVLRLRNENRGSRFCPAGIRTRKSSVTKI